MKLERKVLVSVVGLMAVAAALAQSSGSLRWRSGATGLGLQPAPVGPALQCGPFSIACDSSTSVPLYASSAATRSISMQMGAADAAPGLRPSRSQGLSLAVVGKAGLLPEVGVYGRVGAMMGRGNSLVTPTGTEGGLTYGVGLSWDFSRNASAAVGIDSYGVRGIGDVRAARLGLQWRY